MRWEACSPRGNLPNNSSENISVAAQEKQEGGEEEGVLARHRPSRGEGRGRCLCTPFPRGASNPGSGRSPQWEGKVLLHPSRELTWRPP